MAVLGKDFVERISSADVVLSVRFDDADFALNGSAIPYSYADGARLGMSTHRGSHGSYTAIVREYRDAALRRAEIVEEFEFNEIMRSDKAPSFEEGMKSAEKLANDFNRLRL